MRRRRVGAFTAAALPIAARSAAGEPERGSREGAGGMDEGMEGGLDGGREGWRERDGGSRVTPGLSLTPN